MSTPALISHETILTETCAVLTAPMITRSFLILVLVRLSVLLVSHLGHGAPALGIRPLLAGAAHPTSPDCLEVAALQRAIPVGRLGRRVANVLAGFFVSSLKIDSRRGTVVPYYGRMCTRMMSRVPVAHGHSWPGTLLSMLLEIRRNGNLTCLLSTFLPGICHLPSVVDNQSQPLIGQGFIYRFACSAEMSPRRHHANSVAPALRISQIQLNPVLSDVFSNL
jgi:hypothetical protein